MDDKEPENHDTEEVKHDPPKIDCEKVLSKALNDLGTLMINSVIGMQYPRVHYLYPDFPNGAKPQMVYKSPQEREQLKVQKAKKVAKPPPKTAKLEEPETCTLTKRKSSYKGTKKFFKF